MESVYPHVCGAAERSRLSVIHCSGLSPRVRGSHGNLDLRYIVGRSIPTCAGQPPCATPLGRRTKVYPHVCGAAMWTFYSPCGSCGLSPRVRGSHERPTSEELTARSIPTCAGQPRRGQPNGDVGQVYPHVCGAAAVGPGRTSCSARSIPTCAGQPKHRRLRHNYPAVYPHVCGAAPCRDVQCLRLGGLSPRVRGSLHVIVSLHRCCGSIPTCAGQPGSHCHSPSSARVYPHVCGAASHRACEALVSYGLSPRVRGSLCTATSGSRQARSIPTCAGQPGVKNSPLSTSAVYPHVCGAALPRSVYSSAE